MTGREGKEVTGSVQCCAVNQCDCGKASMTDHEGKEITCSVQYFAANESECGNDSMTGHEGNRGYRFSTMLCCGKISLRQG